MEPSTSSEETEPLPTRYATFTRRFRAVLVDNAVVLGGIAFIAIASEATDRVPGSGRVVWLLMFGIAFLYEPLFIWRRGATIGHAMNHLTVVADGTGRPPGLARAFARYAIKLVLGLPSFVTMAVSRKHQAVHDWLTRTTVQLAPTADLELIDFHLERTAESPTPPPSRSRRTVVALGYVLLLFVAYGVVLSAVDPNGCVLEHTCSASMRTVAHGVTLVWFVVSLASIVATWKELLPGARRGRASRVDAPVV